MHELYGERSKEEFSLAQFHEKCQNKTEGFRMLSDSVRMLEQDIRSVKSF